MLNKIVSIAVGLLVLGAMFPIAINSLISVDTTGWNAAVVTLFGTVLPILAVIGAAIMFISYGKGED